LKKGAPKVVNDPVMVLECINSEGVWDRKYHDFINIDENTENNESKFMRTIFEEVYNRSLLDGLDNIFIFSDGGAKHFKNGYCQRCFAELQLALGEMSITCIVFAPYHGGASVTAMAGY
jgi:hypothetical protein